MKNIQFIGIMIWIIAFPFTNKAFALTRYTACSGNWNTASTWNPVGVPACGDSIIIWESHTIDITNQQNYTTCTEPLKMIIYGHLFFNNGSKLSLPCNSYVIVYPGGTIKHDQGYSNSNLINICSNIEWNSDYNLAGLACLPENHPICGSILPVELVDFDLLEESDDVVSYYWVTATETNTDFFKVERSINGLVWEEANIIEASGNSSVSNYYSTSDENPYFGISFYRLSSHDFDGKKHILKTIKSDVGGSSADEFTIFPNPCESNVSIDFKSPVVAGTKLEVLDMTGRVLSVWEMETGITRYHLQGLEDINDGILLIRIMDENGVFTDSELLIKNN